MEKIIQAIRELLRRWDDSRTAKKEREAKAESSRRVQVKEYMGNLYICVDGMPLLRDVDVNDDLCTTVETMRENWMHYRIMERIKRC